ncbi:hypothetical protein J437_LFUL015670 [Ladona fulva]|uniref:CST complex subunit STN1 n=1 Tax=Ladona fulva TaxID=123851 RepID=A0A8K0KIH6_LADFU|nr:hypothetical protein J437_LFUL015670 [Ladona fulva]
MRALREMNVHLKLFISDILELKNVPNDNRYVFNNFELKNVEIVGYVKQKKEIRKNFTIYQVDDGTGVIECKHFGDEKAFPQHLAGMEKISKLLLMKVGAKRELLVGSAVKLCGSVVEYKGKREILIRRFIPNLDKNEELIQLYEKLALYGEVYVPNLDKNEELIQLYEKLALYGEVYGTK